MNQHIFQSFFGQQPEQVQIPQYLQYNNLVLDIMNNWDLVHTLIQTYKAGKLTNVDAFEKNWLDFIYTQNIDIFSYENEEEFAVAFWKVPTS
jgi:hypothetical protein